MRRHKADVKRAMADQPSREEMNARLEAAEARTEARFAQLTGMLDVRLAVLDGKISLLTDLVTENRRETIEGRHENVRSRTTIIKQLSRPFSVLQVYYWRYCYRLKPIYSLHFKRDWQSRPLSQQPRKQNRRMCFARARVAAIFPAMWGLLRGMRYGMFYASAAGCSLRAARSLRGLSASLRTFPERAGSVPVK